MYPVKSPAISNSQTYLYGGITRLLVEWEDGSVSHLYELYNNTICARDSQGKTWVEFFKDRTSLIKDGVKILEEKEGFL